MAIINLRGSSGSGKSTLVKRFLDEHSHEPIMAKLSDWKTEKVVAYKVTNNPLVAYTGQRKFGPTYIIGKYETQCGGCDSMSYKGSHDDIQKMVESYAELGNVLYEGLTLSSSYGRFLKVSEKFPGQFVWAFLDTPEETCHQRILSRNGGKEPKRDAKGIADYNRKYRGCVVQRQKLIDLGERVIDISSDDTGYAKLLEVLI